MPLLEARKTYKPFEYPWAFEFWKRQQQIHWMPEEVPLGEDCRDWAQKLSEHEKNRKLLLVTVAICAAIIGAAIVIASQGAN